MTNGNSRQPRLNQEQTGSREGDGISRNVESLDSCLSATSPLRQDADDRESSQEVNVQGS